MRIVVLTNGNRFATLLLQPLFEKYASEIVKILIISGDYKGRTGWAALRWLAQVTTLPYLVYKVATIVAGRGVRVSALAQQFALPVASFTSIRSEEAMRAVETVQPDLLVSVSCPQIIPERLLRCATRGGINIHSSLLPRYAGLAPYYWVLADGERETGTTVHAMTPRLDDGRILAQARIAIESRESAFALFTRLARVGGPLLSEAVERIRRGEEGTTMGEGRSYRSHPDFDSYRRLRSRGHRLVRLRELVALACEKLPPRP
jgi:methionyl-tRNA formyltransferase